MRKHQRIAHIRYNSWFDEEESDGDRFTRAINASGPGLKLERRRAVPPGRLVCSDDPEILYRAVPEILIAKGQPGRKGVQCRAYIGDGITFGVGGCSNTKIGDTPVFCVPPTLASATVLITVGPSSHRQY